LSQAASQDWETIQDAELQASQVRQRRSEKKDEEAAGDQETMEDKEVAGDAESAKKSE